MKKQGGFLLQLPDSHNSLLGGFFWNKKEIISANYIVTTKNFEKNQNPKPSIYSYAVIKSGFMQQHKNNLLVCVSCN